MNIFSDPIIDKYKKLTNIKHLGNSQEFFDSQKDIADLIHSFRDNKKDFLFNPFYYQDLFQVIRMFISHERDKKICPNYNKRLVTVAMTVDIAEEYFINEELKTDDYNVYIKPGQQIKVARNNVVDPNFKYQEHEIDAIFLGTKYYLDVKTVFNAYSQVKGFDCRNYVGFPTYTFKKYYNKIMDNEAEDIWLLFYYNTDKYTANFNFINMKTLMKYIHVNEVGTVELIPGVDNTNPFKKDIKRKIIDIDKTFQDYKVIFDCSLCYKKGEFIDYITSQDDSWL